MVVNSINFWIFFLILIIPYLSVCSKHVRLQNFWLFCGSLFFYGYVDPKMVILMLTAILIFYSLGIKIDELCQSKNEKAASRLTTFAVCLGICLLGVFKYLNFFIEQFAILFDTIGVKVHLTTLNILMPLGISFFTFKLMGYVIEIHRENIRACRDFISFGIFISFFPTIMSGPIDHPKKFIPQLQQVRNFNYDHISEGGKRILWGMFLKMCIADRIAPFTDAVFGNYAHHNATSLITAAVLFSFQLYADFAGYSEMAIGVARIMGIKVEENFNRPYFAKNITEFWRKWHMSLTGWITNYIFMPLNIAFRDKGSVGIYLAIIINTVVIGAWHGANWTFVLFGLYHGLIMVVIAVNEKRRKNLEKKYSLNKRGWYKYSRIILTFILWTISLVMFKSPSVSDFVGFFTQMGHGFGPLFTVACLPVFTAGILSIMILVLKEWGEENKKAWKFLHSDNQIVRLASIILLTAYIIYFGNLEGISFIYFQF